MIDIVYAIAHNITIIGQKGPLHTYTIILSVKLLYSQTPLIGAALDQVVSIILKIPVTLKQV